MDFFKRMQLLQNQQESMHLNLRCAKISVWNWPHPRIWMGEGHQRRAEPSTMVTRMKTRASAWQISHSIFPWPRGIFNLISNLEHDLLTSNVIYRPLMRFIHLRHDFSNLDLILDTFHPSRTWLPHLVWLLRLFPSIEPGREYALISQCVFKS